MNDNPLVQPDPGLYIWTIATFLILAALLRRFAWRPLLDALERRHEAIRTSLVQADQAKHELERLQAESARILADARVEADAIISRTRADAGRVADEMKVKGRADAENIVRNAERQIEMETSRALERIRHEAIDLSVAIASKLLRRNLSKEDNERLIAETFKEIEATRRPS
jgi:F-type H+-transporting ATPase subunit b